MKMLSFGMPKAVGNIRLGLHVAVLTVNRDRIFRMHQRIDQLDLLLAGMAGNMDILENHVGSLHGQLVDDSWKQLSRCPESDWSLKSRYRRV